VYNFEYKVSDDPEQTYISQSESRDGDEVVGTYSFVDAAGSLVTVTYQAGLDGYTETRDVQEGVVEIRARPVRPAAVVAPAPVRVAPAPVRVAPAPKPAPAPVAAVAVAPSRSSSTTTTTTSGSSGLSQSDLIAQILASIQPQIGAAVQSAIGASRTSTVTKVVEAAPVAVAAAPAVQTSTVTRVVESAPVVTSSSSSGGLSSIFGTGGNLVRIETPEFNIEY
jgi:hypothetical protein